MGILRNLRGSRISVRVYQAAAPRYSPQPVQVVTALPPAPGVPPVMASGLLDAAPPPYGPDERVFGPPPWGAA